MKKNQKNAFSIIEVLVGIFIFTMGITGVYAIISSTLRLNEYNENYIIAANLANEQLELVRNIRDSNYEKIKKYNQVNPATDNYSDVFDYGKKYKIENNYSNLAIFPIKVTDITSGFEEGQDNITGSSMRAYHLCLDSLNRYTYDCTGLNKSTKFYKYISIEKVMYNDGGVQKEIDNSFLVKSKVIWYSRGYHEFEVKSVIADWKRL